MTTKTIEQVQEDNKILAETNRNCLKEIETLKAQLQDKELVIANLNIEVEAKAEYNHDLRVRLDNNAKALNETTKENQVIHTALYEEQEKNVNLEITVKTLTKMVK